MIQEINLSKCEEEPIHTPHYIQPHGYAIAFNKNSLIITRCSENLETTILSPIHKILNNLLTEVLPKSIVAQVIRNIESIHQNKTSLLNLSFPAFSLNPLDIILSDAGEEIILEIIPNTSSERKFDSLEFKLNEMVRKAMSTGEINLLFDIAAKEIKKFIGYDRVMIYQFDEEFNGKVIAESKEKEMESYMNFHYPASDIPPQARKLFLKNMIRVIENVNYIPVPLVNGNDVSSLIDMSYSSLRSVSPVHIEYLKNMGVGASMTISIIVHQKLWGLIACHHRTPYFPSLKKQNITEIFGNIFGGIIQLRENGEIDKKNNELLIRLAIIMNNLISKDKPKNIFNLIQDNLFLFQSIFASEGFLLYNSEKVISHNFNISKLEIEKILEKLEDKFIDNTFYTNQLNKIIPDLSENILKECAGLMIIKIDTKSKSFWIWRREEKTQSIQWGGDPNNKVILNQKGTISPRKSFEKYNQIVHYQSEPWTNLEKELSKYFIPHIKKLFGIYESSK